MVYDKKKLKEVAGSFPTGVTVVSVKKPSGDTHGMTASSFLSLSLNPPMVLFSIKNENEIIKYIEKGKMLGISILSEDMTDESNHFANIKLMKEHPIFFDEDKVKILKGSIAWYSVIVIKIYNEGDHKIIICGIKNLDIKSKKNPLLYYRGYSKIIT
jgi:flavin reductase (DIM6/NTAB) family NADH-FMN oxidoreductase RutF